MSRFRHLTATEISNLVERYRKGESKAELSRSFEINHATVIYHIKRYEAAYPEEGSLYAELKAKVRKSCLHPSGRCTLCGQMWDELRRAEKDEIARLTFELKKAHDTLRTHGYIVELKAV